MRTVKNAAEIFTLGLLGWLHRVTVSSFQISNTVPNCTPSGEHLGEREASAAAIFCDSDLFAADYHPTFQQISFPDQETAKCGDRRLNHSDGEARAVLQVAKERGVSVLVGLEGMDGIAAEIKRIKPVAT
jgi:hypothetical protein